MRMRHNILLSAPYMIPVFDRFRAYFDRQGIQVEIAQVAERLDESSLLAFAGKIDGTICGDDHYTRKVIERLTPRLKVISKWGTGIDSIDLEAAREFNVQVLNTPGAFTDPVADTILQYILIFARKGPLLDHEMKLGNWHKIPGWSLHERTLGVIGVGKIGRAVLRRARSFGMSLLGNDIVKISDEFIADVGVEMTSLTRLLKEADFISLNCDLNSKSKHLIDEQALSLVKPDAVLINTSRGAVVDQDALIDALRAGIIGGAALDVFDVEPLPEDSPLMKMDRVLLAPHNANSSPAAWEKVHQNSIRNLFQGLGFEFDGTL